MVGRIRAVGGCVRVGGTVWNTLKGDGTEKRGGETTILKRAGKLGQGVGALKQRGLETPYELCLLLEVTPQLRKEKYYSLRKYL